MVAGLVLSLLALQVGPQGTTEASSGNTVAIDNGTVRIEADAHTHALARAALGRDLVRVSCSIRAGVARSWATSLFLYWGPGDWCQMGVVPDGGGGYYVVEMSDGELAEHDVGACRFDSVQHVAIELATGCIRFYGSGRLLYLARREGAKRRAPEQLIVGKGFGTGRAPYACPNLCNDYVPERGPRTSCEISDVCIDPTAAKLRSATPDERRGWREADTDVLGDSVLAGGKDPTFAEVAKFYPPMKEPRETVSVKDHPDEFILAPDGALLMTHSVTNPSAPRLAFESNGPLDLPHKGIRGNMPILTASKRRGALTFTEEAFGYSEGMSPDKPLWAYLSLTVRGQGDAVPVRLRVTPDSPAIPPLDWTVTPGDSQTAYAKVRFDTAGSAPERVTSAEYFERRTEVAAFWNRTLGAGALLKTPDPRVNSLWRMSLAYNFNDVDKRGRVFEPHDGAGFYEEVYGVSAALYSNALDLWGLHADALRYIESLLTMVEPNGYFMVNSGMLDMGALLFAMSQHGILTRDMGWIRSHAAVMRAMCNWVLNKRRETMTLVDGTRPVSYGLLRGRAYCDYSAPVVDYLSDTYCCTGIEWAARVFRQAGLNQQAAVLRLEAAKYRADILASMRKAVFIHNSVPMLPLEPETHRLLKDNGYRGCDYYGLVAPMLLECGFLLPDSSYAKLIADLIEQHGGLTLGMAKFRDGIDHAYTYGHWLNLLERDLVTRVLLGLCGTLAYGMSRDTFAAVEVTRIKTGMNDATTPHLYSGTQQLRLLRNMLVREDGNALFLCQAAPRAWLADGKRISFTHAPTLFGEVSFDIRSHVGQGYIDATVTAPKVRIIRLRLRCPSGFRIASATANGFRATVRGQDILLTPSGKPLHIRARVRRGPAAVTSLLAVPAAAQSRRG